MPLFCCADLPSVYESDSFLYGDNKYVRCSVDSGHRDGFSKFGYEWELEDGGEKYHSYVLHIEMAIQGTSLTVQWLSVPFQCRGRGFSPWLGN